MQTLFYLNNFHNQYCSGKKVRNSRLSFETVMLILISILTIYTAFNFSNFGELALLNFLTEFSAGVLGVLLAFILGGAIRENKKKRDNKDLRQDIRVELEEIRDNLLGKKDLFFPSFRE